MGRGGIAVAGAVVLVLWGLLYRFADGVTFSAAHTLWAAAAAVRAGTSTDPMRDFDTMSNYPWLIGASATFQVAVWLSGAVVVWRKWTEVADRPAPWAALASLVWGLWVAADTATRPWGGLGPWLPAAAWTMAVAAATLGAVGAYRLVRLDRTSFQS